MRWIAHSFVAGLLMAAACKPPVQITPPPADAPTDVVALTGAAVMVGAGDIGSCASNGDELTGVLVDSILRVDSIAKIETAVFTLGDNAYNQGTARQFAECFTPSWGDTTGRIMDKIRPAPGNHEYLSPGADPYYAYFGNRAGTPKKGYYAYDVGQWQVIALNSEIVANSSFTDKERKEQEDWLAAELKKSTKKCTMAYWHHPRYSSGWHGSDTRMTRIWRILMDNDADLVVTGHDHEYERFHSLDADGLVDTVKGLPSFVVGTGGEELRGFPRRIAAHSAARIEGHFGIIKLVLGSEEWRSAFIDTRGRTWDHSAGKCR